MLSPVLVGFLSGLRRPAFFHRKPRQGDLVNQLNQESATALLCLELTVLYCHEVQEVLVEESINLAMQTRCLLRVRILGLT